MEDQLAKLLAHLDERFEIDTVWVFGSQARGEARADSDVDLAVLFRHAPAPVDLMEARADAEQLAGRPVDLVDLDRASPILAMQVLRHGRLLVDRDPRRRYRFVSAAPGRYEDVLIIRRPVERRLLERVAHGRA